MLISTFLLLPSPDKGESKEIYARAIEQAQAADDLGFDGLWIAEHHFSSYGYCPNPLTMAVALAGKTRRIRVGTGVLVLPLRHPVQIAEEIAMADQLTNGRLDVGIGRGYQPHEFTRLGLEIGDSRIMYEEAVDIILAALEGREFSYQGQRYQIPETTLFPETVQKPRPPIFVASQSEASVEAAVQRGFNVLTGGANSSIENLTEVRNVFDAQVKKHQPNGGSRFGISRLMYVADSDEEARAEERAARWVLRAATGLARGMEGIKDGRPVAAPLENETDSEDLFDRFIVFGSPDTCLRQLKQYKEKTRMDHLICTLWLADLPQKKVLRSMELFAKHVMPGLR